MRRSATILRISGSALLALVLVAGSSVSLPGLVACNGNGSDDGGPTTGGARVTLATVVTSDANAPFTTAMGWSVTLSRALVATGPLYFFGGEPILSFAAPRFEWIPTAHAHPGHYVPGDALGENTASAVIDLLAAPTTLPVGTGVTGLYRSARFTFGPTTDERLGGHVVVLEGIATKADASVPFHAAATAGDVIVAGSTGAAVTVEGCPFTEANVAGDGTVTLRIATEPWLDQVDFAALPAGDGTTPVDFGTTVAANAFHRGLEKSSAYTFSFTAP